MAQPALEDASKSGNFFCVESLARKLESGAPHDVQFVNVLPPNQHSTIIKMRKETVPPHVICLISLTARPLNHFATPKAENVSLRDSLPEECRVLLTL